MVEDRAAHARTSSAGVRGIRPGPAEAPWGADVVVCLTPTAAKAAIAAEADDGGIIRATATTAESAAASATATEKVGPAAATNAADSAATTTGIVAATNAEASCVSSNAFSCAASATVPAKLVVADPIEEGLTPFALFANPIACASEQPAASFTKTPHWASAGRADAAVSMHRINWSQRIEANRARGCMSTALPVEKPVAGRRSIGRPNKSVVLTPHQGNGIRAGCAELVL